MKKQYYLFILLLVVQVSELSGQSLLVAPIVEKTVTGYEYGSAMMVRSVRGFAWGAFYQGGFERSAEGTAMANPFYGSTVYVPVVKCDRLNLLLNTRVGIVNRKFLVIVPAVETEIKLVDAVSLGIGMSLRRGFLAANTSIKCKLVGYGKNTYRHGKFQK